MKNFLKDFGKPAIQWTVFWVSAIASIVGLSYAYAAFAPLSSVNTGDALSKTAWNAMVANLNDLNSRLANVESSGTSGTLSVNRLLHIQDKRANGQSGQNAASGWVVRDLNTVLTNTIAWASLAGNSITLPAGTYFISASAPTIFGNHSQSIIWNVTDSAPLLVGTNQFTRRAEDIYDALVTNYSDISGVVTFASPKTIQLQSRVYSTYSTFGWAVNFGYGEVYSDIKIWKTN